MTFESLKRGMQFYEALAIYDRYYAFLDSSMDGPHLANLAEVRPLTWVPLVFHCTDLKSFIHIASDKFLKARNGYVSFTECPIDQLDRFRFRGKEAQIAIGFPRINLEQRGLFQPLYLKHSDARVKEQFSDSPPGYVEMEDDLGAFSEVRVPGEVPLSDAVWILCSKRNPDTHLIDKPKIVELCQELGISRSYWHHTHLKEVVLENVYRKVLYNDKDILVGIESCGEYYFKKRTQTKVKADVRFPSGKSFELQFPAYESTDGWEGPFTNFQMAFFYLQQLRRYYTGSLEKISNRLDLSLH